MDSTTANLCDALEVELAEGSLTLEAILVIHSVRKKGAAYWDFGEFPALTTTHSTTLDTLETICGNAGWSFSIGKGNRLTIINLENFQVVPN